MASLIPGLIAGNPGNGPGRLPLHACPAIAGDILDADGLHVLTVLPNGAPPDEAAHRLAALVAYALNAQANVAAFAAA